ncbi:MAG: hypothetical protein EP334_10065 [Gammaproteobacteria bacterium]|nr:MAG: hypothetical protein EP334_10065 [Gammaproteobacteria bacterium]
MMSLFGGHKVVGKEYAIEGLEKPVIIIGLSGAGVEAMHVIASEKGVSPVRLYAWMVKQCCPQFRWWSMSKVCQKLPAAVLKRIFDKCMEESAVDSSAVDRAKKNCVSDPSTNSSLS